MRDIGIRERYNPDVRRNIISKVNSRKDLLQVWLAWGHKNSYPSLRVGCNWILEDSVHESIKGRHLDA